MKTRKRAKKGPIIITLLILIGIVFGILYYFGDGFKKEKEQGNDIPKELNKEETELSYSTSFTLAGNVLVNSNMWYDTLKEDNTYDFAYTLETLKTTMKKSNINFYSQQSIIGGKELGYSSYYNYNSPIEIGKTMVDLGFNMVSLANYHAFDKGIKGITNSTDFWKENNVTYSGTSVNEEERLKNNTITKNGVVYGLLSYTTGTDTKFTDDYQVNVYSTELLKKDVNAIKDNVDVVIVSIDWSDIKSNEITQKQKEIATYLSELGVDLVIGNTGYSVLPIEKINNTLVCYSLGNLLSGHISIDSRISAIVNFDLKLVKKNDEKNISFENIKVLLTFAYNKDSAEYKVVPFTQIKDKLPTYKTYYDKYKELLTNDYVSLYELGE